MSPAKTVEPIEMPFGMLTRVDPMNQILDGGPDLHTRRGNLEGEKATAQDITDMSGGRYTQSDSAGGSIGTVLMPIVVY